MPRSIRDSDEDFDTKLGRKGRTLVGPTSVDSPRRSSRIKLNVRQNDSSPDSSLSDSSNISNTQTRLRTRRVTAMDSSASNENHRSLRSRMNSVSLDISEVMNVDLGTPTKKTKGASNDTSKGGNSRRSKRLTRAGSEANSPPSRATRNTRASSMEPESSTGTKNMEQLRNESTSTLTKTNRRISMIPSEATVIEEKEEFRKIAVVALDRLEHMSTINKKNESLSISKDTCNASRNSLCDTIVEEKDEADHNHDDNSTKKLHHKPPEDLISNSSKEKSRFTNDEVISNDDENNVKTDETLSADVTKHKEPLVDKESQMCSQSEKQDTSKELKDDDLNNFKDKHENNSDKENIKVKVTSDLKNTENATSNALLSSPKSLPISNINANELTDERSKSPCIGAKRMPRRSRQLSELSNDNVSEKECTSIVNPVNSSTVECIDFSDKEEDDSERIRIFNTSADSTPIEMSKSPSIIGIANSSISNSSIEILDCSDFPQDNELNEQLEKIDSKEYKTDVSAKSDVPNAEKSISKNEEPNEEECKMQIESDKLNASEDGCNETSCVEMQSPSHSNNVEQSEPMDAKSTTEHTTVSEHTQCSETKEETNNLSLSMNIVSKSLDASISSKDSVLTNTNKNNVSNVIKTSQSSVVAETSVEFVEGRENMSKEKAPEKEEKSKKVSAQDDSVTLREQCTNVSESNKNKSDSNQTLSKDHQENMEIDDNDPDVSAVNLFQDIPVTEWTEKYAVSDKNSVHSLSTERLENESEGECDLVLVDREAWLNTENIRPEKESSDYDSDDTVLLKAQKDSMKEQNDEETLMDASIVERKLKVSKSKSSNKSNKRKVMEQKGSKNKEEITKGADVTQDTKDGMQNEEDISVKEVNKSATTNNKQSALKLDVSESHRKSLKIEENVSLNKSKLSEDVSKKRKSLNKSSQEADNKLKESSNVEIERKRKSLSISNCEENETNNTELSTENVLVSFEGDDKNESLNKSLKKKVKAQRVDVNITEESTVDEKSDMEKAKKKEMKKNVSAISNVGLDISESKNGSDGEKEEQSEKDSVDDDVAALKRRTNTSETNKNNSNSEQAVSKEHKKNMVIDDNDSDENVDNQSITLPNFLFGGASSSDDDNDSDKTMDSDIQKEYNLHGKDIGKFSDDDVPGDECRASETESSDPDDNGSDLADFVVDDDEEEEGESEVDESEETENEELDKEEDAEVNQNDDEDEMQEEEDKKVEKEVVLGENKKEKQNEDSISKSLQTKKSKQKRTSSSFIVEDIEQSLNESQLIFGKKVQAFNKSMTCSTPKIGLTKQEKNDMKTTKKHDFSNTKETENIVMKEKVNLKKLNKINGNESLMHKSLPSEFVNIETKTNLSRPMSSKVEELNKTTLVSTTETPTTKFLRKEKLNESAPVLKGSKLKKLIKANNNKEQNDQVEQDENANEPNVEMAQDTNDSLKKKLLKVADNILENDRPKKRKKRKQLAMTEPTNLVLFENDSQGNRDSEAVEQNKDNVSTSDIDNNNEAIKVEKKKKKKKTDNADMQMKELAELKVKSRDIDIVKKRKKKMKTVENVSDLMGNNEETKIVKNQKKVLDTLQNENNLNEQLPKKKQRKQKLLSNNNTSQEDKEALREQLPKKKKKVLWENNALQSIEEGSATKISKKKQKSLKNNPDQDENMLVKKVPKKKQKLSQNNFDQEDEDPSFRMVLRKKQKLLKNSFDQDENMMVEIAPKKIQKLSKNNSDQDENTSLRKVRQKKQKLLKNSFDQDENASTEKMSKKKQKLSSEDTKTEHIKCTEVIYRPQQSYDAVLDSDEAPETVAFSKARDEALEILKRTADSIKANKEMKKKKRKDHIERMHTEREMKVKKLELKSEVEAQKTNVTRLPDDVVRNLSDVPFRSPQKNSRKRRLSPETKDTTFLDRKSKKPKNMYVEDDFTVPSCAGSTTEFRIVNLQKMKKKKKIPQVGAFRQRMLARNSRQPISAYLMYLEKQKASGKNKFCNKPY
ncbi:uncharacterized protein LOC143423300 isoform X2 [Xylocopa sonorina]|uniref:uncharacterized protein LOC143423300 isoform X2 n=1 Tax=Xylocopa sonorina TaxID=1818115 RepID=UPI00403A9951